MQTLGRAIWFISVVSMEPFVVARSASSAPAANLSDSGSCLESDVLILGAGAAGIAAAKALHERGISNFTVLEYQGQVGGRLHSSPFGKKADGSPYTVELGGNWITGLTTEGGVDNPIWALAKEHGLETVQQDWGITVYDENGRKQTQPDDDPLWGRLEEVVEEVSALASDLEEAGGQDRTIRSALRQVGWHPEGDVYAQGLEWYTWEWDAANSVDRMSLTRETEYERTESEEPDFTEGENLVIDPRGYSYIIKAEGDKIFQSQDPRLQLNTTVTEVTWSNDSVTAKTQDGRCFKSKYAICTFSLGVLQRALRPSAAPVSFSPDFPRWKVEALAAPDFGTYTKIFLQFPIDQQFWPSNQSIFFYVHPTVRGRYTIWQSLSREGYLPDSGIIFTTVVDAEARRIEAQSDNATEAEALEALRQMFPDKTVPQPIDFKVTHWGRVPWSFGSFSSTPADATDQHLEDLGKPVGRLHFAGEHTSLNYQGYAHGAYIEGLNAGQTVADLLKSGL